MTDDIVLLRFDAPLMSFGGPAVDHHGVTEEFPARSMLTGLLANALGYDHRDADRTQRLQERLVFAARRDRRGQRLQDFQTVDLDQPFLKDTGWTTRRRPEDRAGGSLKEMHIRYRSYLADAVYTIALQLVPPTEAPGLDDIERALREPARPLFLGRKCCLPAGPLLLSRTRASGVRVALKDLPRIGLRGDEGALSAWWATETPGDEADTRLIPVTDDREWRNQIHVGRRFLRHGTVSPPEATHDD